jgi:elongation factor 3
MQDTAISSMSIVCASVGNRDIDPFIPSLISAIARPAEVPDCVHKLSATTFVQVCSLPTITVCFVATLLSHMLLVATCCCFQYLL